LYFICFSKIIKHDDYSLNNVTGVYPPIHDQLL